MMSGHSDEFRLIAAIAARETAHADVKIGIGDDAAVLTDGGLLASDTLLESRHFEPTADMTAVGHKAIAVNLSDIAAMGGRPSAATVSLTLRQGPEAFAVGDRLMRGLQATAAEYGVAVVGGDTTTWDGPVVVSVTVWGNVEEGLLPVLRGGGSAGDRLYVTGPLGGSLRGRHLTFPPRVREGVAINRLGATAMIDLSDGLASDVRHLAAASGCGAVIDGDRVPRNEGVRSLEAALSDGEDFELLFAMSPEQHGAVASAGVTAVCVGELTAGPDVLLRTAGKVRPLDTFGFSHAVGG